MLADREGGNVVLAEIRGDSRVKRPNRRHDPATYLGSRMYSGGQDWRFYYFRICAEESHCG